MKTIATIAALCATANAFYKVKDGVECASKDSWLGRYSTVAKCAARAQKMGGKFFIYGVRHARQKCYIEWTKSAKCTQGWNRRPYNFYSVADKVKTKHCTKGYLCFKGWHNQKNLKNCQGDCDSNSDCAKGLKCKQSDKGSKTIPGCKGNKLAEVPQTADFCYRPANDKKASDAKKAAEAKAIADKKYNQVRARWAAEAKAAAEKAAKEKAEKKYNQVRARWAAEAKAAAGKAAKEKAEKERLAKEKASAAKAAAEKAAVAHTSSHSSHSHSSSSSSSHHSVTVTHSSSGGHTKKVAKSTSSSSGTDFSMSGFPFLDSPDHMAEAERKRQEFLSENIRLSRNRALKTRAYFNARDVAAAKHKWTAVFYSRMLKAKSFHAAMKSLHTTALAHELAMQVKRRTAFTAWMIARNTNERALHARKSASAAFSNGVKAFELARDAMAAAKKTLAEAWAHYRSTLKIRVAAREEYVKWGKAHRSAIKGREAAGLKAAEASQAYMMSHKKHTISVTVHIAAVKRRAAAKAAAIRAHIAVKRHAFSGFKYLAQKN